MSDIIVISLSDLSYIRRGVYIYIEVSQKVDNMEKVDKKQNGKIPSIYRDRLGSTGLCNGIKSQRRRSVRFPLLGREYVLII